MINRLDKSGRARFGAMLLTLWLGVGVVGCNSLLDVDNPNNVVGEDILIPSAAQALANGALYEVSAGYTYVLMCYSQATDETHWVGSRDAFQQLDYGNVEYPLNEFTDQAYRDLAPARWMADKAIGILEGHLANNVLPDEQSLSVAYLWGALAYVTIADMFDDFTFSDMMVPQPPIGPANMGSLYTTAIGYTTSGMALDINAELERNLMAMRARARHAQGVWNLIGTMPISTGTGLISAGDAAAAATDAAAALALDPSDWTYSLVYPSSGTYGDFQGDVNSRLEHRFGNRYIIPELADKRRDRTAANRGIRLMDPVGNVADMRLDAIMTPFEDGVQYSDLPILSAREMHLILAEDALVRGDNAAFATNINAARAWGGLSDWTAGSGVSQLDMLIHERQVNLFVQGRRLNDMYRFGITSDNWEVASTAFSAPGTFFPITKAEIDANCYINPDWPANVSCPPGS
jgi:hypothetical protein